MTIEEITHETFYNMENYSQVVLDLVSEVEDADDNTNFGALSYDISNILEVIDKSREEDIKILKHLKRLVRDEIENQL